ncbi:MAG: saccharopine dehydrogenase family protein [Candidatus Hodarchaeales archaeon]|jgi:lysine 6-dehydrogenase
MPNYAVLGLGYMGSAICYDLLTYDPLANIFGYDLDPQIRDNLETRFNKFNKRFQTFPLNLDLKDEIEDHPLVESLVEKNIDVVFGAIDYKFNYWLTKICIQCNCSFVDLGGNPDIVKQQQSLNEQAQAKNVTIIPDLGLAPGMINIIAAHGMREFDSLEECHIRVGGLPQQPDTILNYQQVFAIRGLTNEYLEEAKIIREGKKTIVPSLTEVEILQFPKPWGELEAFQTAGGSSSLPDLFERKIKDLTYKTIRYPGHVQFFQFLKEFQLLSNEQIIESSEITPREVIEHFLEKNLPRNTPDVVLARITVKGTISDKEETHTYQLIDLADEETGFSAMARTTSYPTSIIGQFIAHGKITSKGVCRSEECVPAKELLAELEKRKIIFEINKE